ncbi:MAG: hypothetical protein Q9184_007411 [Pyrenodesmia sp. 2 TL-2023]
MATSMQYGARVNQIKRLISCHQNISPRYSSDFAQLVDAKLLALDSSPQLNDDTQFVDELVSLSEIKDSLKTAGLPSKIIDGLIDEKLCGLSKSVFDEPITNCVLVDVGVQFGL